MDTRHHPGCLYLLQHPCANLPCPSAMTYIRADDLHEHPRTIPTPQSYRLSTSHGLEEPPLGSMHPLKSAGCHVLGGECHPFPGTAAPEPRLYRSLENLHWAESSVFAHYRSMDSEFILHCSSTRHLSEGSAGSGPVQSMMDKLAFHRDLPMPPLTKLHHWLFPTVDDKVSYSDAKRELKEKLRTHSSKPVEPTRPVRPQTFVADCLARAQASRPCQQCKWSSPSALSSSTNAASKHCSRTTPEHIKQEARRRLQLRRQNSSPDLTLHQEEADSKGLVKSKTAESFHAQRQCPGRRESEAPGKPCIKGPLYIPTFEEFKRMRNKERSGLTATGERLRAAKSSAEMKPEEEPDTTANLGINTDTLHPSKESAVMPDDCRASRSDAGNDPVEHGALDSRAYTSCQPAFPAPICSSPVPRSPFQALSMHSEPHGASGFPGAPQPAHAAEAHSTCCPSLILEATDLSGYSAKLQKMKDGLIGSALDLIKKSCSTERLDPLTRCDAPKSDSTAPGCSMASASCEKVPSSIVTTDHNASLSSAGCRRSSSDMTHEAGDSGKSQRGCRLRPHFSDPMPTDAVKRKQLELKIAAAARHHAQRQRQDKDNGPVLTKANTTTTCSSGKDGNNTSRRSYRSRHRWSNISSLSTDSGIVGVNDEREECEGSTKPTKGREVERVDSGIGDALSRRWRARKAEAAASLEAWEAHRPCTDCGESNSSMDTESRGNRRETLCAKCVTRRLERKEAVMEFINTETSYREDLRIIKEEFYLPMQMAGLLSQEQLMVVFSNIQELIDLNEKFLEVLQEEIDQALDQGDDHLITVCIGEIFLDFANMLPAFQTYCLQQPTSVATLNALEKDKELLRIFLDVSQNDNTALRRMNLRSFLMAPLQRVTKYPLLLSRILKSTTEFHPDHGSLWEAKSRIESHLEHINMKTKQEGNTWTLRSFRRESRKTREVTGIEMRDLAVKQVGWPREETRFIKEGPLQLAQPTDGHWVKKGCKALKFQNVHALLMVNAKRTSDSGLEGGAFEKTVKDAVLVLIKDKSNGKFAILRDPLRLGQCVVSTDPDCEDIFELLEIRKEGFVFRDGDSSRTRLWFRQMKSFSQELGTWQRRRNALPNIMISTAQTRCSN